MKRIVFLILVVLFWQFSSAQQLANSNFESWIKTDLFEMPNGWTTSNEFSVPIGPTGVSSDSLSFEGILSARIITTLIGFAAQPYPGFIVNGKMNVTGHYDVDSIYKAGEPFSGRPNALLGYYRYTSEAMIEDWGHAFVILKKYNPSKGSIDTVGYGSNVLLNPTEEFREFRVPITYLMEDVEPDSIVVAFFSTYPKNPLAGGMLWVDHLTFNYTTGREDPEKKENIMIYPNPVGDRLFVNGPVPDRLTIFNSSGRIVQLKESVSQLDTSSLPPGIYFLQIENDQQITRKKFIKNR